MQTETVKSQTLKSLFTWIEYQVQDSRRLARTIPGGKTVSTSSRNDRLDDQVDECKLLSAVANLAIDDPSCQDRPDCSQGELRAHHELDVDSSGAGDYGVAFDSPDAFNGEPLSSAAVYGDGIDSFKMNNFDSSMCEFDVENNDVCYATSAGRPLSTTNVNSGYFISQTAYTQAILEKFAHLTARGKDTPMEHKLRLSVSQCPQSDDEKDVMKKVPYRQAIGSLMYLAIGTRPDIAAAVGAVSSYNENPGEAHWVAVMRIFRYLRKTLHYGIWYRGGNISLEGFCDADWANCVDTRRSVTGYVFLMNGGAISWRSKKQPTVAASTAEAEYISLSEATKEILWLRMIFADLKLRYVIDRGIRLHVDNQGAIAIAKNQETSQRSKHIDVRFRFVHEHVDKEEMILTYHKTEEMTVDTLTKALDRVKFEKFRTAMGIVEKESLGLK
ncbi:hypothetical protein ON010_g2714 [Phytophthora cinnamomi]|nr:hypothetical protein ON010_g2714 [Phytophthora cinnamomi]